MSKTAKVEARVLPARLERYRKAADKLKLDELSDFVRRACDDFADQVLGIAPAKRDLEQKHVTPRPRKVR